MRQSVKVARLNAPVVGDDLTGDRDEARDFLARLIDGSPRENVVCGAPRLVLMLMTKHVWAEKLNRGCRDRALSGTLLRCDGAA